MRGSPGRLDFEIVPTETRHARGSSDVINLANGYPVMEERRLRHTRVVAEQIERFPRGQFVALTRSGGSERVIGTATTMRTHRAPDAPPLKWHDVIGDHGLSRHEPAGAWLYGVEIAVHPAFQRRGVASALYRARLALVGALGLRGWYAGGMLMGYHRYAERLSVRAYAEAVIAGRLRDPTVSMQLNRGLVPAGIIEGYYPEPKAGDGAVLLTWQPRPEPEAAARREAPISASTPVGTVAPVGPGATTRPAGTRPAARGGTIPHVRDGRL